MTDREKLDLVFRLCQVPTDTKDKSITAAGRKFHFNDGGEVDRIIDYQAAVRVTAEKTERIRRHERGWLITHASSQFAAAWERLTCIIRSFLIPKRSDVYSLESK